MQEIIKIDAMIPLLLVFCGSVEAILFIYSALHILCFVHFPSGRKNSVSCSKDTILNVS